MLTPYLLQTRVNGVFATDAIAGINRRTLWRAMFYRSLLEICGQNIYAVTDQTGKKATARPCSQAIDFIKSMSSGVASRPPSGKTLSLWAGKPQVPLIAFDGTTRVNQPAFEMRRRLSGACGSCLRLLRLGLLYTSIVHVPDQSQPKDLARNNSQSEPVVSVRQSIY